ncbi:hypothetical protein SNEBB_005264 [Seison nebaliae]|nr:hypothetical protein SNEBB_005264 [Seison nebaliae]
MNFSDDSSDSILYDSSSSKHDLSRSSTSPKTLKAHKFLKKQPKQESPKNISISSSKQQYHEPSRSRDRSRDSSGSLSKQSLRRSSSSRKSENLKDKKYSSPYRSNDMLSDDFYGDDIESEEDYDLKHLRTFLKKEPIITSEDEWSEIRHSVRSPVRSKTKTNSSKSSPRSNSRSYSSSRSLSRLKKLEDIEEMPSPKYKIESPERFSRTSLRKSKELDRDPPVSHRSRKSGKEKDIDRSPYSKLNDSAFHRIKETPKNNFDRKTFYDRLSTPVRREGKKKPPINQKTDPNYDNNSNVMSEKGYNRVYQENSSDESICLETRKSKLSNGSSTKIDKSFGHTRKSQILNSSIADLSSVNSDRAHSAFTNLGNQKFSSQTDISSKRRNSTKFTHVKSKVQTRLDNELEEFYNIKNIASNNTQSSNEQMNIIDNELIRKNISPATVAWNIEKHKKLQKEVEEKRMKERMMKEENILLEEQKKAKSKNNLKSWIDRVRESDREKLKKKEDEEYDEKEKRREKEENEEKNRRAYHEWWRRDARRLAKKKMEIRKEGEKKKEEEREENERKKSANKQPSHDAGYKAWKKKLTLKKREEEEKSLEKEMTEKRRTMERQEKSKIAYDRWLENKTKYQPMTRQGRRNSQSQMPWYPAGKSDAYSLDRYFFSGYHNNSSLQ